MASSARPRTQHAPLVTVALAMPASVTELAQVHAALDRFWVALAGSGTAARPTGVWRMQFTTAVAEIAGNIAAHAHMTEPAGTLRLRLRAYPDRVEARFSDRGAPYALPLQAALPPQQHVEQALLDAYELDELDELAERGRGLAITRAAVDELHYRRTPTGRNHWRLMKRFVG